MRKPSGARRCAAAAIAAALWLLAGAQATAAQPAPDEARREPAAAAAEDPEAGGIGAPVELGGVAVTSIHAGVGPFTAEERARRISERLESIVHNKAITDLTVTVSDVDNVSQLKVGEQLVMAVTERDAEAIGVARATVARTYAEEFGRLLREERARYAPETLRRAAGLSLVATVVFAGAVWALGRVTRWFYRRLRRWRERRLESLRVRGFELLSPERISATLRSLARVGYVVGLLVLFDIYVTYVLGLFPWTRGTSLVLLDYAVAPLRTAWQAFVAYLPSLFFLVAIAIFVNLLIKVVGAFFGAVQKGHVVFEKFPAEWADPTNKIIRVLIVAFAVVIAFPYMPGSSSPAFAGVSVFIGVLFSLASSSSLSNMIAGLVLTYTRAFRMGDRVRVGETTGDVVAQSLLATRLRTIKNEDVTIPNAMVLNSQIVNYSSEALARPLILHTSVTIGYDAPWRQVHELLLKAAAATDGILDTPAPFVWQTALNDFYVNYEINASTARPHEMMRIYADLHANIQDAFNEAGVEIMSPHFSALRDGNTITIPETYRPPGYDAPRFRLDRRRPDGSGA